MLSEIDQFVNWVHRRNPASRTWRDYGYDLKQFAVCLGDIPPNQVTSQEIDRFVAQQVAQGFLPTTINRRLAAILSLYAFLSDEDACLICPVLPHRHHLREPLHLPRPVQEEDLRRFFAVINDPRDRAMFALMLRCGLRISEVASLQLSDLYLDEPASRLMVRGKGLRERSVYLSPQSLRLLQDYLAVRPKSVSPFVFLSYQLDGLSTTAIHKRLMTYRAQAGVQLTAHRLRHSFANDLLCADVPVTTIQKLLGHRWLETTQIYVQANDPQVRDDFYAACLQIEGWVL